MEDFRHLPSLQLPLLKDTWAGPLESSPGRGFGFSLWSYEFTFSGLTSLICQVEKVTLAATDGHVNFGVCGHGAWHTEATTHGQSPLTMRARPSITGTWRGDLSGSVWLCVWSGYGCL